MNPRRDIYPARLLARQQTTESSGHMTRLSLLDCRAIHYALALSGVAFSDHNIPAIQVLCKFSSVARVPRTKLHSGFSNLLATMIDAEYALTPTPLVTPAQQPENVTSLGEADEGA